MNPYNPKHNPKARRRFKNRYLPKPTVVRVAPDVCPLNSGKADRDPDKRKLTPFDNSIIGAYTPSIKLHHGRPHGVARINRRKPVPQAT